MRVHLCRCAKPCKISRWSPQPALIRLLLFGSRLLLVFVGPLFLASFKELFFETFLPSLLHHLPLLPCDLPWPLIFFHLVFVRFEIVSSLSESLAGTLRAKFLNHRAYIVILLAN